MKWIMLIALAILSFTQVCEARTGWYGGRGSVKESRRLNGASGQKHFCYPVGNCVTHSVYVNKLGFLGINPYKDGKHLGEDWNGPKGGDTDFGDPVYSTAAGVVTFAKQLYKGWGKCIIISHHLPDGTKVNSLYGHLETILVKQGDVVALHQKIGTIGNAEGMYEHAAHLHFEIRKGDQLYNETGPGYTFDPKVIDKYYVPTDFINKRLPPLFKVDPIKACTGALKKYGSIYDCNQIAQGGVVGKGETISPLVTIRNVWVNHRIVVHVFHNKKLVDEITSPFKTVNEEYGWSTSQYVKQVKNAQPGEWKFVFEMRYNYKGNSFDTKDLGEVTYIVTADAVSSEVGSSTPWFMLKTVEVCKEFAGGKHTDWVYNCLNPKDEYTEGESFHVLVGIMKVLYDHRFVVDITRDGTKVSTYKSGWNDVPDGKGWETAYTWPKVSKAKAGKWKFVFSLEFKDGSFAAVTSKTVVVKKKDGTKQTEPSSNDKMSDPNAQSKPDYVYIGTDICGSIGGPDKKWKYWCLNKKTIFNEGESAHVLTKIVNVWAKHRFRIKVYRNGVYQWQWATNWAKVDPKVGWEYSHFFPAINKLTVGTWKVEIFVATQISEVKVATRTFTVKGSGTKPEKEETPKKMSKPNTQSIPDYVYKGTDICGSIGGPDKVWKYWCVNKKTTFNKGDSAHVLTKIVDIWVKHRFRIKVYRNGAYQWQWATKWAMVNEKLGWKYSHFFPAINNLAPGTWKVEVFVETQKSPQVKVATKTFVVKGGETSPKKDDTPTPKANPPKPKSTPSASGNQASTTGPAYVFQSKKACTSLSGGKSTGWKYTCQGEKYKYSVGDAVYFLVHFTKVTKDHRFKILSRKNNVHKWTYITPWNNVGNGTWENSYFFPKHSAITFGNWEYEFFIQTKGGTFKYVGSVKLSVKY